MFLITKKFFVNILNRMCIFIGLHKNYEIKYSILKININILLISYLTIFIFNFFTNKSLSLLLCYLAVIFLVCYKLFFFINFYII